MAWTPEQDAMLRQLALEKYSASQAADAINERFGTNYTRCALIGRLHRTGGEKFASGNRAERPERRKVAYKAREPKPVAPSASAFEPVEPMEPVMIPASTRVSIFDLTPTSCRFPLGDPGAEDFGFCGDAVDDGCVYCDQHARIAYREPTRFEKRSNWSLRRFSRDLTSGAL